MTEQDLAVATFEQRLGYSFQNRQLLHEALTHRSFANEQRLDSHYERLEFLGDAVLGLMTVEWLYERFPTKAEGTLSKLKSRLVSTNALAGYATRLELGEVLRLGVGEDRSGGRSKPSLLEDSLEAVLGAVWLDGGSEATRRVIRPLLEEAVDQRTTQVPSDTKTRLQEELQGRGLALPEYRLAGERGPDHEKLFCIECWVEGELWGAGEGRSKKRAQQRAAAEALEMLSEN